MEVAAPAVDIAGPGKRYGKTEAASSLIPQFRVRAALGLVGANGAGKTTLIKSMLTLTPHSLADVDNICEDIAVLHQGSLRLARTRAALN